MKLYEKEEGLRNEIRETGTPVAQLVRNRATPTVTPSSYLAADEAIPVRDRVGLFGVSS